MYAAVGAHPSTIDKRKRNAMHHAANQGHANAMVKLESHGCPVDVPDIDEWTPLMHASNNGHFEAVKCLVDMGPDRVNTMARSETHNTAHDYAWNLYIRGVLHKAMKKAIAAEEKEKQKQKEEEAAKVQQLMDEQASREAAALGGDKEVAGKLHSIFSEFDKDGSGDITKDEFVTLCKRIKYQFDDESELEAILDYFDSSGDGDISYEEFTKWWSTNDKAREAIDRYHGKDTKKLPL